MTKNLATCLQSKIVSNQNLARLSHETAPALFPEHLYWPKIEARRKERETFFYQIKNICHIYTNSKIPKHSIFFCCLKKIISRQHVKDIQKQIPDCVSHFKGYYLPTYSLYRENKRKRLAQLETHALEF
jgi:hypothetical protein